MKLEWSPLALDDIDDYAAQIADDEPAAAKRWRKKVRDAASNAKRFPRIGKIVAEFDRDDLREIIAYSHRVIYRITDTMVEVVRVWHGARLLTELDIGEFSK